MPRAKIKKLELTPVEEAAVLRYLREGYVNPYPNPTAIITGYYTRRRDERWVVAQVGRWADAHGNTVPVFDRIDEMKWIPYLEKP